jgi:hypothetical protein
MIEEAIRFSGRNLGQSCFLGEGIRYIDEYQTKDIAKVFDCIF